LATNILLFLIAFRLVNAFTVRTFFQPDEFFQSLEPAWQIAFGENQGAWITWVSGAKLSCAALRRIRFVSNSHIISVTNFWVLDVTNIGMEASTEVFRPSSPLRRRLLRRRCRRPASPPLPRIACGSSRRRSQNCAGGNRGARGLLYLEVGSLCLWL
jgi:hypothetical protein